MASKIRSITVNFNAGTAKFVGDVDRASAKIKEFGGHTVSNMQASSAAIRTFEGNIQNNVRAVERFLTSVLPLGPVLRAAFPVIGAIAFAGLITEVGKKVNEFFKDIREAPERIRNAFSSANAGLKLTNDEWKVANDRLENDIAKLEGKHQNTLKLTIDEARMATDHLVKSLDKALEELHKLVDEDSKNWFQKHVWDVGGDGEFGEQLRHFRTKIEDIAKEGQTAMSQGPAVNIGGAMIPGAVTPESVKAAQTRMNARLMEAYDQEIANIEQRLRAAKGQAGALKYTLPSGQKVFGEGTAPDPKAAELAGGALDYLKYQRAQIPLVTQNAALSGKKEELQIGKENAQQDRPFEDRMKKFRAEIDAVQAKLSAIGKSQAAQNIAKAFGESQKAIEEVNKALERHNTKLTDGQKSQIRAAESTLVNTEAEAEWKTKLAAGTSSVDDRIRSQNMLTAAIGKGYEATKAANVETKLMAELGQHYGDAGWMKDHASDVAGLRGGFGKEFDAQHAEQVGQAVQKLTEEIALEKALAAAQRDGAEAVRQAGLAMKLRQMAAVGATKAQMQAELELYGAQRENASGAELAKLQEKIAATERLTAAIGGGAEAMRLAANESKYAEIRRGGDQAVPGVFGMGAVEMASRGSDSKERQAQLTEEALKTGMAYQNATQSIELQLKALNQVKVTEENALAIEISRRNLENERLEQLSKEALQMRGAQDGVRAFFIEMQKDAESAAEIVYNSLKSAVDRVSGLAAKMLTEKGPKGGWGKEWGKQFQELGGGMVQSSLKSAMQFGLGKLGAATKADGSANNPFYVRLAGMSMAGAGLPGASTDPSDMGEGTGGGGGSGIGGALSGIGNIMGTIGKLFHFGGFMAEGGPTSANEAYIVGEKGPEILSGFSGRVMSNTEATRTFGGGGGITIHGGPIDARGADLGAHNRIARAQEMGNRAAAATAVQAMAERAKRVPR